MEDLWPLDDLVPLPDLPEEELLAVKGFHGLGVQCQCPCLSDSARWAYNIVSARLNARKVFQNCRSASTPRHVPQQALGRWTTAQPCAMPATHESPPPPWPQSPPCTFQSFGFQSPPGSYHASLIELLLLPPPPDLPDFPPLLPDLLLLLSEGSSHHPGRHP